ncbi:MAG: hypothetical protein ACP5I1_13285 [Candidatus Hinthialibacter sp.]
MTNNFQRRTFIQMSAAGSAAFLGTSSLAAGQAYAKPPVLISPGCRSGKVKIAKIYLGQPNAHWPSPDVDINKERQKYEDEFAQMKNEFADVDFVVDELISKPEQIQPLAEKIQEADGLLLIHLTMGMSSLLNSLLAFKKPAALFAAPYSGHEWVGFGQLRNQKEGALLECFLTSDVHQLADAVRPFRAIHHLQKAKILNITARDMPADFVQSMQSKFGVQFLKIERQRVLDAYESIPGSQAKDESRKWIAEAEKVVEPSEDEIFRSCKLALAFEKLLNEENATVITADCYGTMYHQLPAFPCIGFTRLNDMGLGGICESDLRSAMTHIIFQGLTGKPGFISDPTFDVSINSAILAHCLGSTRMNGPQGDRAPYRLRTIMERQEGAVPQVRMKIGQKVTQAILPSADQLLYFTGDIIDTPQGPRGCRTKITVQIDGDAEKLWQNWTHGLHRVTCYGNIVKDLQRFCRYKQVEFIHEAV